VVLLAAGRLGKVWERLWLLQLKCTVALGHSLWISMNHAGERGFESLCRMILFVAVG
jgi:hypothetical protein